MQTKEKINSEKLYSKKLGLLRRPLLNYAKKRVFNHQDAEDIVQNTLLILFNKKSTFDAKKSFLSWGLNICQFQIKSYLTNRKRSKVYFVDDKLLHSLGEYSNQTPTIKLMNKEKHSVFQKTKHLLNKRERKILSLAFEGFKCQEIMDKLKINRSLFSANKSRGLQKIKKHLKNQSIKEYQL